MKRSRIAAAAALAGVAVVAVGALSVQGATGAASDETHAIVVQGSASVAAVPDRLELAFGVETRAPTAKAALAANSADMRGVIAAVKAAGATDVKTLSVSLSAQYGSNGELQSFSAANSVSATVTTAGRAGTVIDAAVEAGANQVSGPAPALTAQAELYRQALKSAVADARLRAQALAAAAEVVLGRATSVVEQGGGPVYTASLAERAKGDATPIEPGTQEVTASVTVTFAIT